jgi:hypothetical protein
MRKILTKINIIQEKKNENGFIRHRLNPYNPLSYIYLVISFIAGLFYYGIRGLSDEMDMRGKRNPFKWQ